MEVILKRRLSNFILLVDCASNSVLLVKIYAISSDQIFSSWVSYTEVSSYGLYKKSSRYSMSQSNMEKKSEITFASKIPNHSLDCFNQADLNNVQGTWTDWFLMDWSMTLLYIDLLVCDRYYGIVAINIWN